MLSAPFSPVFESLKHALQTHNRFLWVSQLFFACHEPFRLRIASAVSESVYYPHHFETFMLRRYSNSTRVPSRDVIFQERLVHIRRMRNLFGMGNLSKVLGSTSLVEYVWRHRQILDKDSRALTSSSTGLDHRPHQPNCSDESRATYSSRARVKFRH